MQASLRAALLGDQDAAGKIVGMLGGVEQAAQLAFDDKLAAAAKAAVEEKDNKLIRIRGQLDSQAKDTLLIEMSGVTDVKCARYS